MERVFELMLQRRWVTVLLTAALTAVLAAYASRVKPDFAVEAFFPVESELRRDYERFKADFPYEDALALVVVEASDLWTPQGLARIEALEKDLAAVPGTLDTDGLTTTLDLRADGEDGLRVESLIESTDLSPEQIAEVRELATTDPLFTWRLAPPPPPEGPTLGVQGPAAGATTIVVTLESEYARGGDERMQFLQDVRPVIERHRQLAREAGVEQRLELSGIPIVRSQYNELVNADFALFGAALLIILALLYASLRSVPLTLASLATILFAVVWTYGAMGISGYPIHMLTSITPLIVMIISISDTVHIVSHYREARQDDAAPRDAVVAACAESAIPCLLTEITIAAGFLTLLALNIEALSQFGVATAIGMFFAWLANMLVLPLLLDVVRPRVPAATEVSALERGVLRIVGWVEGFIQRRAWVVAAVVLTVVALAVVFGSQVQRVYYSFDDLYDDEPMKQTIDYVETIQSGMVPLMVYIEPPEGEEGPDAMCDPVAIGIMARTAEFLERFPQVQSASSAADFWGKSMRLFAPDMAAESGGLPPTREAAVQLALVFGDTKMTRHHLREDRGTAAVVALVPNVPSTEGRVLLKELGEFLRAEEAATGYRLSKTGLFANLEDIDLALVEGLAESLSMALLITLTVFCFVLRSPRLALLALVPNVMPLALTFAFMGITGIELKPSTVIVFSITLVIADDNTIQYFSRFRPILARHVAAGAPDPRVPAALETLRRVGLPIFLTAGTVTIGFLILLGSNFKGLTNLGLLTGVSLASSLVADLFLSPLLAMRLGPRPKATTPAEP
jgi:predicted RND superfamily exporter protein